MIVAVTYIYHDYEPEIVYFDTDRSDSTNPCDKAVLKGSKISNSPLCNVNAAKWETRPKEFSTEPGLSHTIRKRPDQIDRAVILWVDFDC